ncbi:MAG: hypothetical protein HYU86_05380 [Chloroflexi bacterium]|nr:hypothetical protein [Chloroflexota bacterium]
MSLGIAFKGPEGIVLAADSRVTLTMQLQVPNQPPLLLPSTYDNATKLLRVKGQDYIGAVTYGTGAIGLTEPRTAHSYMPELEKELEGVDRLSVQEFANRLSQFFLLKWQAQNMPTAPGKDMVFLVGGYDDRAPYGRVFEVFIPSRPTPNEWHAGPGEFGLVWGGQKEFADRLIAGFDGNLPELVKDFLNLDDQKRDELRQRLQSQLQARVPFAFLPLQDCVDLAIFLIRTTIVMQHWVMDVRGVGGAIDVAVITPTDGFTEIQKKKITGEEMWS